MADEKLSPQLAALFANLVEEASGLHYSAGDRDMLASKVTDHATDAGYSALIDYYYRLRYDDPDGTELRALLQALVVHETYFFRELTPLVQLVETHLAPRIAAQGRVRVWSAACSTGEEPSTLAMLLDQRGLLDKAEIIATDLSDLAIGRARSGLHGKRAVRDGHPSDLAARYLEPTRNAAGAVTGYTLDPQIRAAIRYSSVNLRDDAAVSALGTFDAIVCRNVLIYFADATVVDLVGRLFRALRPGGLLAVGVSESLLRFGTSLVCEERGGAFFYRPAGAP